MSALLAVAVAIVAAMTTDPTDVLTEATRTYDLRRAEVLASALEDNSRPEETMLRARAWLLVAELRRIAFEELSDDAISERRALGKEIDAAADAGLAAADLLEESSETYRIRADLLGARIRSWYRAGKYKDEMDRAIAAALELDPGNARALVSRAKTLVLRPEASEDELQRGRELLDQALAHDNTLEQARLLQAYTWEQLGQHERARDAYSECLQRNSDCVPAAKALTRLKQEGPGSP